MACNNCSKRKQLDRREVNKKPVDSKQERKSGPTDCQCEFNDGQGNIFCERHQVIKTRSLFELCRQRHDYFQLWEDKRGPFQNLDSHKKKKEPMPVEEEAEECTGLGDTIEKFTKVTGIKKVVDAISKAVGKDCGCENRKEWLNKKVPYKPKKTKGFFE